MEVIKTLLVVFFVGFLICGLGSTAIGLYRTSQVEHSEEQQIFIRGKMPSPSPEGLYKGTVPGIDTNWVGKKFSPKTQAGINVFKKTHEVNEEQYPFKTYVGKGVRDKTVDVLKIDYNVPNNPWWTHFIIDEVVQTDENKMLGKLNLDIIPGVPFALGFFRLEKPPEAEEER